VIGGFTGYLCAVLGCVGLLLLAWEMVRERRILQEPERRIDAIDSELERDR
jgi:hypothetical protein